MNVLIVDDEELVRRSLRRVLEKNGHRVFEAENGQQGYDLWVEGEPDLVFLDIVMPEMNGPQLLKKMGDNFKALVILMSAYSSESTDEAKAHKRVKRFLSKPFDNIFEVVLMAEKLLETA